MKAETTYMKTLGKIEAKLTRMKEQASAVRWFYENGNLPESYNRALRLEELSEQTVLLTRVLPAYTGAAGATVQTDAIISDTIPVEVGFTAEGWFSVRIPALLPKKASGSADYIRSYLYPAMRKFFDGKPPVRFRDCVLAYRHVMTEADRNGPCGITIISKPIWSRIFWRCMFCPTITRQFARITIAALPEARTARKSM